MAYKVSLARAALLLAFILPAFAQETGPQEVVTKMTQDVLAAIKSDRHLAGDRQKARKLAEEKVLPHIDFEEATRIAVGRAWAQASPAQRTRLVHEFRAMLVRVYTSAGDAYQGDTLRVLPVRGGPQDDDATVRTQFLRTGGQPLAIEFHVRKTGNGWKIYDIAVEGVSLVLVYRSEFDAVMQSQGIEGLIRRLSEKNASALPA
jgi:phospholipid transport system substrate-binding protein